jgi:peptidoglycan/LPS O-acetylase OafA/YrhL
MTGMKNHRFRILDGWRGVCALFVALFHLDAYWHFYDIAFVRQAWLFVDFFFVLSGFVISYAYMDRLAGWPEARSFIVRRFGRLWPLHIAVLTLLVLLELLKLAVVNIAGLDADRAAFSGNKSVDAILANIPMIHSLGIYDQLTWNFPSWSISTEFYTYLVFAGLFTVVRKPATSLLLSMAIAIMGAAVVAMFSSRWLDTTYDYGFFRCVFGFFVGHLTYRLWRTRVGHRAFRTLWSVEILCVAGIVVFVTLVGRTAFSLAAPIVFGFAVWVFAHESGPVSRLMAARPIALLGAWSYSIYLGHALIFEIIRRALDLLSRVVGFPFVIERTYPWSSQPIELIFFGSRWMMDGLAVVYLAAVVLFAALTYQFVEQPGRRFFNSIRWANPDKAFVSDHAPLGESPR